MVDYRKAVIINPPPRPPESDTEMANYRRELNRWLTNLQQYLGNPFYLRGTGLFFPEGALSTSGYGLRPGEVFANDGVLTIVREGDIWIGSFAIGVELGELTVTV